ncbi:hypothetical protein GF325_09655 [Candidatus Bathyarchaeota archaeon]|nr:hypothetical protein [Candidatus Bathyarchaeota archaeon]
MAILDFMPLFIQAGVSFSSDWYYHEAGLSMDENTMTDPAKRLEYKVNAIRYDERRFPKIFMPSGSPRAESTISPGLGWGVTTLASCLGARIRFNPKMDPTAIPQVDIHDINVFEDIAVPEMHDALAPVFRDVDAYVDMGFRKGQIGLPNLQGPLNIAFESYGDNQIMSFLGRKNKEDHVKHILGVTSETFMQAHEILRKELGRPAQARWTVAGCTYYYLSPRTWKKYIIPVLHECIDRLGPVSLHHCGVANAAQLQAYSEITWQGLEFGFGTDICMARRTITNEKLGPLNISCRMSPYRMLNQNAAQIKADVEWLIEKGVGGPQRIAVVGCPHGTPDKNIYAMWDTIEAHNRRKAEEEGEEW